MLQCQKFGYSAVNSKANAVCQHCAGNHESRQYNKFGKQGETIPSRQREVHNAQIPENDLLNNLLSALDKLRELPRGRPILAELISLTNHQGLEETKN
ncbi:hypothetical protein JTB14_009517 [Gonioctena quinquepunctata]|nr:hypothetical protein JTB14_009517 [Gonioctena quinquepunctata]